MVWNKESFSIYDNEEKQMLGLLKTLGEQTNFNTDEVLNVKENNNKKVSYDDMNVKYNIDENANFTGSWYGIKKPSLSNEGMATIVDKINDVEIPSIKSRINDVATINYVDLKIGNMGSLKTFKGSCLYSALPLGVTVDDYWYVTDRNTNYCWNGTSWIDIGNNLNIGENAITQDKISKNGVTLYKSNEFTQDKRFNLFDKSNFNTKGYYNTLGKWDATDNSYGSTNFISVDEGFTYKQNFNGYITLWDSSYIFVQTLQPNGNGEITIPTNKNIKYINCSFLKSAIDSKYLVNTIFSKEFTLPKYKTENILITSNNIDKENFIIDKSNANFIIKERTENLFNVDKMNKNGYYNPNNGIFTNDSTYWSSELIEVEEGSYYTIFQTGGFMALFDSYKQFVGGKTSTWDGLIPTGVKYVSWVVRSVYADTEVIWKNKVRPSYSIPYYRYKLEEKINTSNKSELTNLKWLVLGDSISSTSYANGHPYWWYLAQNYNMNVEVNAVSGACISKGGTNAISETFLNSSDNVDLITVFAGTNDDLSTNPLGTMEDRVNTTFYGALHVLYSGLINKYPGKKIGIISIMQRSSYKPNDGSVWDKKNNAILEVARYYNIPVFKAHEELNLSPHVDIIKTTYIEDGLHPNEKAHKEIISRRLKKWLESL